MNLRAWMLALTLWLGFVGLAGAGKPNLRLEASQLVTGKLEIDAQGGVIGFTLDKRDKLPEDVLAFLGTTIPQWRFEPVLASGQPTAARSDMSLRLVLKPVEGGNYALSIKGVHFSGPNGTREDAPRVRRLDPPRYPMAALHQDGGAEVYLLVKVGRDGRVEDAMAEQTNLLSYDSARSADELRGQFEDAAIGQARKRWKFQPPTVGEAADAPYWTVRVPVIFSVGMETTTRSGWKIYEPGPRRRAPWTTPADPAGFSPDALPGGGAHLAGAGGLRLLSMGASH